QMAVEGRAAGGGGVETDLAVDQVLLGELFELLHRLAASPVHAATTVGQAAAGGLFLLGLFLVGHFHAATHATARTALRDRRRRGRAFAYRTTRTRHGNVLRRLLAHDSRSADNRGFRFDPLRRG